MTRIYNELQNKCPIYLYIKGSDCSSELFELYEVIARLVSIVLQYGAPELKAARLDFEGTTQQDIEKQSIVVID